MLAETRLKLIAAARAAFGSAGYASTSMDELTASAGLTRGALYHHFGSKEGLLEAVIREIDQEIALRYRKEFDGASSVWDGFAACGRAYLRLALEPEIRRIVLQDAPAVLGQRLRAIDEASSLKPMIESLTHLIEAKEIEPCPPEALARLLNGALVDAALWIAAGEDVGYRLDQALSAYGVMLDGLRRSPR